MPPALSALHATVDYANPASNGVPISQPPGYHQPNYSSLGVAPPQSTMPASTGPGQSSRRPRILTVDEALQYSPFASILPFDAGRRQMVQPLTYSNSQEPRHHTLTQRQLLSLPSRLQRQQRSTNCPTIHRTCECRGITKSGRLYAGRATGQ